jgi:uncharacterized protein (TIGR02231 family)
VIAAKLLSVVLLVPAPAPGRPSVRPPGPKVVPRAPVALPLPPLTGAPAAAAPAAAPAAVAPPAAPVHVGPPATPSRVAEVVVYPDRAQVTRAAELACNARTLAVFEGLPPSADQGSFRAKARGGEVQGLRVEQVNQREAFAPQVEALDLVIRDLEAQDATLRDAQGRAERQATLAGQYADLAVGLVQREMGGDAAPSVAAWTAAFDLSLSTRLQAGQESVRLGAERKALQLKLQDKQAERSRLDAAAQRSSYRAEVQVACAAGQTAHVELTYRVGGAGWDAAYEARAEESSGVVELSTYATVRQATGEPWKGAHLLLSTAVPRQNATPPELLQQGLWVEERSAEKKVLVRREETHEHAEAGGAAAANEPAKPAAGLAASNQGLSVQLEVPEAADVLGEGAPVRLFVARTRMPAKFALRTAPALSPFVFRVADLDNAAPFPLLAGPMDTFGRSGFTGRVRQERVAQGARFHLTFGVEEGMKVKRKTMDELKRETGLFGGNHRFTYAYQLELANFTPGARDVEVQERVPVSELDDVKVTIDAPKTEPGYEQNKEDGLLTWKLKLRPGDSRTMGLTFYVDVPGSYDLGGM